MPRLSSLRVSDIAELARELRFASPEAARRHLERTEKLARDLLLLKSTDKARSTYPLDWLVYRITGLRREAAPRGSRATRSGGGAVETELVFEALLGDLCGLAQRLSRRAGISPRDCPPDAWLSTHEVCQRWGCERKRVERAHRQGLVSRRVLLGGGRERAAYSAEQIEAFENAYGPIAAPKRVSRAGPDEFAMIVARARELLARENLTLNACASRLSLVIGRSRQAIRRALEAHDARAPTPIFPRRLRTPGGAARLRRLERARSLGELDLRGPVSPLFEHPDADDVLLGSVRVRSGLAAPWPSTVSGLLALATTPRALSSEDESLIASACCYLLFRARLALATMSRHHPREAALDRIETDLRWCSALRRVLVVDELPLLMRTIESHLPTASDPAWARVTARAASAGMAALIEVAGSFDPFKGGRLAAPASIAIGRAVSTALKLAADERPRPGTPTRHKATPRSASVDLLPAEWPLGPCAWDRLLAPPKIPAEQGALLVPVARAAISRRFGLDDAAPMTLEQTASALGVSTSTIRAALRQAIRPLKPDHA